MKGKSIADPERQVQGQQDIDSITSQITDVQLLQDRRGGHRFLNKRQKEQRFQDGELFDIAELLIYPTRKSALEASQRHIQSLGFPKENY